MSVAERWANSTGGRRHKLKVECSSFRLIVGCQHEGLGQAVGGGGGRRGAAGEAIKLVTVMCLSCACHVPAMCLSCNYHVAIMWLSCDYHVTDGTCCSCPNPAIGLHISIETTEHYATASAVASISGLHLLGAAPNAPERGGVCAGRR